MRFHTFLASRLPMLIALALSTALCAAVVWGVSGNASTVVLIVIISVLFPLFSILVDYFQRHPFLKQLARINNNSKHAVINAELVDEPTYPEGRIAWNALRAISKASMDEISSYRQQSIEYREYVESWVHEAKSPLAAAHLMLDNLKATTDSARINALESELDRTENYIEQALFFARSESLDRDYIVRSCALTDLVSQALRNRARLLIGAHVAPRLSNLEYRVFTDEKWMLFIFGQLIDNSVKYARANGAEISFSARILDQGCANERVELTIKDNGCGVCEADLPRVFDRGFTGANGRTREHATGLGLYLVKSLCEKMALTVNAASEENSWFAITIAFPTNKTHYFELTDN